MAPPTCLNVLSTPDAAPATGGAMPRMPTVITTANPHPRPAPVTTSPGMNVADVPIVETDAPTQPPPDTAPSIAPTMADLISTHASTPPASRPTPMGANVIRVSASHV